MNLLQALFQMLSGHASSPPGPTLQMRPIVDPVAPVQARPGVVPQSPIAKINPLTGKRQVQHFVPVPQPPVPAQTQTAPHMRRKVITKDLRTGRIAEGPWEDVPVTPISPDEF